MATFKIDKIEKHLNPDGVHEGVYHTTVTFTSDDGKQTLTDTMCDIPVTDKQAALDELAARCIKWHHDLDQQRPIDPEIEQEVSVPYTHQVENYQEVKLGPDHYPVFDTQTGEPIMETKQRAVAVKA